MPTSDMVLQFSHLTAGRGRPGYERYAYYSCY